jgi:enoyl-CoA hydratase/carnithine racemase
MWRRFDDYAGSYKHVRMQREDGILELTIHTDGGPAVWSATMHEELGRCFWDVGRDAENKVVVLTATGDSFIAQTDHSGFAFTSLGMTSARWDVVYNEGRHLITNLLAIEVPVVIAVNGPAIIHSELAVMGDVVIATPDAVWQDTHYKRGMVPGDGVHVIWPELLGSNKGRHFLYMGAPLNAQDALAAGVIAEIVERDSIVGRAHEIAREIAEQDDVVRRYTRILLTRRMRGLVEAELSHGLSLEGIAHRSWPPAQ